MGVSGWNSLQKTLDYFPNNIFTIADAKRGDIGTTSQAYANAWLGENACYPSDALTVNPWMGIETLNPFIEIPENKILKKVKFTHPYFCLLYTSDAADE